MITLAEINEAYRNASQTERQEFIDTILPELEESPIFKNAIETVLLTSGLKPIKRIHELEKTTGHYQFEDFEEHEPTIPEQISLLSEKIDSLSDPLREPIKEPVSLQARQK